MYCQWKEGSSRLRMRPLQLRMILLSATILHLSKADTCGISQTCFRAPANCYPESSCIYFVGWSLTESGDTLDFEVSISGDNGYIALGFSKDKAMPMTDIILCGFDGNIKRYYAKDQAPPTKQAEGGISNEVVTISDDNTIHCTFTRQLNVAGNATFYDLNKPHYLLLASGPGSSEYFRYHGAQRWVSPNTFYLTGVVPEHTTPVTTETLEESDTDTCGVSQSCFRRPYNCLPASSCDYFVGWTLSANQESSEFEFTMSGNNGYIAVGFSKDDRMPNTDIIGCLSNGDLNRYYAQDNVRPSAQNESGVSDAEVNIGDDGRIKCTFTRPLSNDTLENFLDFNNEDLFILVARGELDGHILQYHSSSFVSDDSFRFSFAEFTNAPEICVSESYSGYTFPDTTVNVTASSEEKCDETKQLYGEPLATRNCVVKTQGTVEWDSNIIISDCGGNAVVENKLDRIIQVNVTEENVEEISNYVDEVTQDNDEITIDALEKTATILDRVANAQSNSSSVTTSMVSVVNNLFKLEDEILMESQMQSQAPTDILQSLEKQLSQVELTDNKYQNTTSNVAVLSQILEVGDFNITGLVFGSFQDVSGLGDITSLQENIFPNDLVVSIEMSPSIISTIIEETGSVDNFRVVVVAYGNSKLFQSSKFDSSDRRPNGPVMSFTVAGISEVNFKEPVTITFIPDEISDRNENTECAFWDYEIMNGIGGWSSKGCTLVKGSSDGSDRQYCHCDHLTNFAVLMDFYPYKPDPILETITKIGLALSITGLSLTLLTLLSNKTLRRSKPRKVLCNLCASLLCLYIVFLAGVGQNNRNKDGCTTVGALLHYFLLSSTFWMTVQAIIMYYLFVIVYSSHIPYFHLKAVLFAWGTPALIVLATIFYDIDGYVDESNHCFLALGQMYVSVVIPLSIALLLNTMMFILVMHSLNKHAKFSERQTQKNEGMRMVQNAISITLVLGLTWLFGFFAIGDASRIFNLLFCIFNSLQGFLIFVMYCVRNK